MEEMEKRSRRRTRDLVTQPASQGLSENEIGCARISMMARSKNAPCKGRIQIRKTNPLHLLTFGLQRTAGPYSWVNRVTLAVCRSLPVCTQLRRCRCAAITDTMCNSGLMRRNKRELLDHLVGAGDETIGERKTQSLRGLEIYDELVLCGSLDWEIRWFRAPEYAVDVFGCTRINSDNIGSVGGKASIHHVKSQRTNRWQAISKCQREHLLAAPI